MSARFAEAALNSLIAITVMAGFFLLGLAVAILCLPNGPLP